METMELQSLQFISGNPFTDCPADIHDCNNADGTHNTSLCDSTLTIDPDCVSYHIGNGPSYTAITSSAFSCLGSILIVLAFIFFKDIRGGMAQRIITALAIADFVSAAGYIAGSINYIVHYNDRVKNDCTAFRTICQVQAFITTWSSMSSFAWTAILAVYFYLVLVYQKQRPFNTKYRRLFLHIFSWVTPGLIVIPFTGLNFLGYAPFAASNWCFVTDLSLYDHPNSTVTDPNLTILYNTLKVLAAGKFWEILTYIVVIIMYSHIIVILERLRRNHYGAIARPERAKAERKMIYIPVIFLLLRIWGTAEFFLNIGMQLTYPMKDGCILKGFRTANIVLGYFQAIGDPGQGWGNALLYIFMSDIIRKRMFSSPLRRCTRRFARGFLEYTRLSDTEGNIVRNGPPEQEVPSVPARPGPVQQYSSITSIAATEISHAGPLDEEARPGPSPVHHMAGQRRLELPSETTTTTTTLAIQT